MHSAQVPKTSRLCWTSRNPCSAAILAAHRSTGGSATSTVRPHERQTRWWWCSASSAGRPPRRRRRAGRRPRPASTRACSPGRPSPARPGSPRSAQRACRSCAVRKPSGRRGAPGRRCAAAGTPRRLDRCRGGHAAPPSLPGPAVPRVRRARRSGRRARSGAARAGGRRGRSRRGRRAAPAGARSPRRARAGGRRGRSARRRCRRRAVASRTASPGGDHQEQGDGQQHDRAAGRGARVVGRRRARRRSRPARWRRPGRRSAGSCGRRSCATALGTIISALMSSRPTTRMESTTVEATSAASTTLRPSTGRPDGAGVLLVVAHRVEALPEQHDGRAPRRR